MYACICAFACVEGLRESVVDRAVESQSKVYWVHSPMSACLSKHLKHRNGMLLSLLSQVSAK